MRSFFLIFALFFNLQIKAQDKTYFSRFISTHKTSIDLKEFYRKITITNDSIVISKFENDNKEDYIMLIDSLIQKEFNFFSDGISDWYYGKAAKADFEGIFRKGIIIIPHSLTQKHIYFYDFADEVNVYCFRFDYK